MNKLLAIINVIAWSGFWAFGYLALTGTDYTQGQLVLAALLAALGFMVGIFTYLRLCNVFTPVRRAPKEDDE